MVSSESNKANKSVRVLIVDDHPVVRSGLRAVLSGEPDIEVVAEAGDGLEAEDKVAQFQPNVVLMDIFMPRRDGLESMVSIKQKFPGAKVLLMTVSEEEENLIRAIRYGADGYLLKGSDVEDVPNAVRQVASGKAILSSEMTARLMKEFRQTEQKSSLTTREREVLELIAKGLTTAKIAERLFLSQGTVSTYVYRLLQKLHLKNKAEAVAYFVRYHGAPESSPTGETAAEKLTQAR
ncbi:MAG: response regulator transcription factor [Chloroflexi bacterium]|nr:response regulator transcription factor [Chloroflexota bacterium]